MAGLGASFAIFGMIRAFANPAPHTMNKEWQESVNERLIVSTRRLLCQWSGSLRLAGTTRRPSHRYHLRKLQGSWPGPVSSQGPINRSYTIAIALRYHIIRTSLYSTLRSLCFRDLVQSSPVGCIECLHVYRIKSREVQKSSLKGSGDGADGWRSRRFDFDFARQTGVNTVSQQWDTRSWTCGTK